MRNASLNSMNIKKEKLAIFSTIVSLKNILPGIFFLQKKVVIQTQIKSSFLKFVLRLLSPIILASWLWHCKGTFIFLIFYFSGGSTHKKSLNWRSTIFCCVVPKCVVSIASMIYDQNERNSMTCYRSNFLLIKFISGHYHIESFFWTELDL